MATILFHLTDEGGITLANARLAVACSFKDGETWKGGTLTADAAGEARLEVDAALLKRFNWSTMSLQVSQAGRKLPVTDTDGPTKEGRGTYRFAVTVSRPSAADKPGGSSDLSPGSSTHTGGGGKPSSSFPGTSTPIDRYEVSGTVKSDQGLSLANLNIRAVDRGIGKEKPLGSAQSDASGHYRISYQQADLLIPTSGAANLVVSAFTSSRAKTFIAASPMKQSARKREIIHLVVDQKDYRAPSLFEIVEGKFEALNLDTGYGDLIEEDALLIAKQTQLDIDDVHCFINAQVLSKQGQDSAGEDIAVTPLFGILRAGLEPTTAAFAASRDSILVNLLNQAVDQNWVGEMPAEAVIQAMRPARAKLLAEIDPRAVAMIHGGGASDAQTMAILDRYLGGSESLLQSVQQMGNTGALPGGVVASAQESIALLQFTGGKAPLVTALADEYGITRSIELSRLSSREWSVLAKKYFPSELARMEGSTQAEKITNLANELARQVESAYPTAVFSQQWKADNRMENSPIQTYLDKNPRFDFASETLADYWAQIGKTPAAKTKTLLERTERLFHISSGYQRFSSFKACWDAGIGSASDVLDKGRGRFVRDMAAFDIDARGANDIYRRAQRVWSRHLLELDPAPVAVVDVNTTDDSTVPARISPTIASLFGAQGGNGCPHCISAFSPAAYLVDMLRYLQRAETDSGINGLDLLFLRRPDIANLQLDCENSDTVIPYIDLVNEVLEHVVATSQVPFQVPLDWMVEDTLDLQTEGSADDLAAHPEHLNVDAYNRLRLITAPWTLPYNLWFDEVQTYLAQIGVDRGEILAVLRPDEDPYKVLEVAADRLGVDAIEALVLSLPADSDEKRLLIWQTADPAADLKGLQSFLKRTGFTYEETRDIFARRFVNPRGRAVLPTDLRDLDNAVLNLKPEDNDGLLDRFHRFARLWRKSGWTALELDAVMQNVVATDLDESSLAGIGIMAEIQHRYGTPAEELAAWFGPISSYGSDSAPALYQRSFLDGSVNGVVGDGEVDLLTEVFALTGSGKSRDLVVTQPSSTHDKWLARESQSLPGEWELHPEYSPIVMAACKLTADTLTAIVAAPGLLPKRQKTVALNLSNLSQLFRTASIAKALGVSVQECIDWQRIIGEPLGVTYTHSQDPATTLLLLLGISSQTEAGVNAAVLRYALLGDDVDGLTPTDDDMDALLGDIHSDLFKTADEHRVDTPVAEEQLRLWFGIDPSLVVDDSQDDVATLLTMIDGSAAYDGSFQSALDFLSANTRDLLFVSNTLTNKEERLLLAASEIPVDPMRLAQADALLWEDDTLDEADITDLLGVIVGVSPLSSAEQTELVTDLLPYLSAASLAVTNIDDRLRTVCQELSDYWVRRPIVTQRLSAALEVTERHIELLAEAVPAGDPSVIQILLSPGFMNEQPGAISMAIQAVERMHRQCALVNAIDLDAGEVAFTLTHGPQIGLYDFHAPGEGQILNWHATVTAHEIHEAVGSEESDLYGVLGAVLEGDLDEAGAQAEMAALFGIAAADLSPLVGEDGLNFAFPDSYLRVTGINRLYQACGFVRQTGVAGEQVLRLAEPIPNTGHAGIARAAVRSHYDENSWLEVSGQLREGLRERQRDALLAFVLTRGGLDLSHEHAYAYYLIDMDMAACYQTTRLKQATASVQQFIQRILLGLEPANLAFPKEDAAEWKWRKNYRVWEANVKVFVHPENWLVPELRDDKTPFFKAFEQELMQGELTTDLGEKAVTHYLEKLHGVSNLQIVGLFEDDEDSYALHVIGRSPNTPHDYFYRIYNGETWTPWEPIEMDIEGDHIIPVVYNRRLRLFWATFTEEVDEEELEKTGIRDMIDVVEERINELEGSGGLIEAVNSAIDTFEEEISDLADGGVTPSEKPIKQAYENIVAVYKDTLNGYNAELTDLKVKLGGLELDLERATENVSYQLVQMNWIVRDQDGWSSKRVVKHLLEGPLGYAADDYQFLGTTQGGGLTIQVVAGDFDFSHTSRDTYTAGLFTMSDCTGELIMVDKNLPLPPPLEVFDSNSQLVFTRHLIEMTNPYWNSQQSLTASGVTLLDDSPQATDYATKLHQVVTRATPFFLASGKRTFFVEMKPAGFVFDDFIDNPVFDTSLGGINKSLLSAQDLTQSTAQISYGGNEKHHFSAHYHPYTCACLRQIRRYGIPGLYSPDPDLQPERDAADLLRQTTLTQPRFDFQVSYQPNTEEVSGDPIDKIDFSFGSAYSQYNWELFFHIPMMIATRLMQDRKYDQAQQWLHYIFDPTEKEGAGLEKYWKIKPFYYAQMWGYAQQDLDAQLDSVDEDDAISLDSMIEQWEQHPFQPFAIARFRIVAFMRMTVMTYLDNLIAWGDSLFKRDTMESINEATQLYVLAANILGERPLIIDALAPGGGTVTVKAFLDGLARTALPAGQMPATPGGVYGQGAQGILGVIDQFCLPYNDHMLDYWDTVSDRLFKIRHCMNIDGVFRLLPIYQPPIDPALLVRAAAAGLDIGAVLSDLSPPRPHYRFAYLLQKASELASMTQGLGNQLLSALEKQDAESLARLRGDHEVALLKLGTAVRQDAVKEAKEQISIIEFGQAAVELRRDFYAGRLYMNNGEGLDLVLRGYAWYLRTLAQIAQAAVTPMESIPVVVFGGAGIASPVTVTQTPRPADSAKSGVGVMNVFADLTQTAAGMAQTMGQYDRRQEEWDHQVALAEAELSQFEKQLAAADIRLAMAEKELANQEKQIEYSEEAQAFLKDKFTNQELYSWMVSELSGLYFQAYQLAYDMAKRAERCYQHELGINDTGFIQFGYWDSLKKGLLAGDRLQLDLKRMETSYLEKNLREMELSKTVSLSMLDPEALLRLTETGECFFNLPEQSFDLDYPGHYFRRIKNVSLTLPAVTGPYTTVSCTLTLLSDRYRHQASIGEADDDFTWNVGATQSIATSSGQADSGLFQLNFQDERYLPFERAGVISSWKLSLARPDLAQFDYSTISDVLIHVNYTARDGGENYRTEVEDRLTSALNSLITSDGGFPLLISLKNYYPDAWARMRQADTSVPCAMDFDISPAHLPFFLRNRVQAAKTLTLFAIPKNDAAMDFTGEPVILNGETGANVVFASDPTIGVPMAAFTQGTDLGAQNLEFTPAVIQRMADIKDMMLVLMLDVI